MCTMTYDIWWPDATPAPEKMTAEFNSSNIMQRWLSIVCLQYKLIQVNGPLLSSPFANIRRAISLWDRCSTIFVISIARFSGSLLAIQPLSEAMPWTLVIQKVYWCKKCKETSRQTQSIKKKYSGAANTAWRSSAEVRKPHCILSAFWHLTNCKGAGGVFAKAIQTMALSSLVILYPHHCTSNKQFKTTIWLPLRLQKKRSAAW